MPSWVRTTLSAVTGKRPPKYSNGSNGPRGRASLTTERSTVARTVTTPPFRKATSGSVTPGWELWRALEAKIGVDLTLKDDDRLVRDGRRCLTARDVGQLVQQPLSVALDRGRIGWTPALSPPATPPPHPRHQRTAVSAWGTPSGECSGLASDATSTGRDRETPLATAEGVAGEPASGARSGDVSMACSNIRNRTCCRTFRSVSISAMASRCLRASLLIMRGERQKLLGERRLVGACLVGHPLQFSQSALPLLLSSSPSVLKDPEPGDELRILLLAQVEHLLRTHELERLKEPLDFEGGHVGRTMSPRNRAAGQDPASEARIARGLRPPNTGPFDACPVRSQPALQLRFQKLHECLSFIQRQLEHRPADRPTVNHEEFGLTIRPLDSIGHGEEQSPIGRLVSRDVFGLACRRRLTGGAVRRIETPNRRPL